MEALQRITRRMAHKLLKEKSLPNRLQRLKSGGFKRKAEFLTLAENKRRKLAKLTSPSTDTESVEEAARLKKEDMEDMEVGSYTRPDYRDGCDLMNTPQSVTVSGIDNDLDCGVSGMDGCVSSEILPFVLSLAFDTDSEEQSILDLDQDLSKGGEEMQKDDATSTPIKPLEELDSAESDVVQVEMSEREIEVAQVLDNVAPREIEDAQMLDKMNQGEVADAPVFNEMTEGEVTDAHACNIIGSLSGQVKEEPETEGGCLDLNDNKRSVEGEGTCKFEQLKRIRRSGPGSKWMYSGSRFAAFLRSAVGVIDLDADDEMLQNHGKAAAKQKSGAIEGRCVAAPSPPKRQSARFPGKRKVTLSPSSQLKLLEASKSSSYRRMLPFCAELAKDLAMVSSAQTTIRLSPRTDCTASKGCDIYADKGLTGEPFIPEHIKGEENENNLASAICDQGLSSSSTSKANVELEDNRSQRELPTSNKRMSREPQCIELVKVEQNENQMELIPSDDQISMKSSPTGHVKLEQNDMGPTLSNEKMIMGPPCAGQVKLEQNDIEMELHSSSEGTSRSPPRAEHIDFKQNGCQIEFVPGNEEFSREPLATKPAKLKENASELMPANDNGPSNAGLSIGRANFEQSGNQLESVPGDQFLSRKSLFVENMRQGQNGNQSESAIGDQSSSRESFYTGCVKPDQTECQSMSASIQLESSPACHLYGPSDELGNSLASQSSGKSSSLVFSNGQCISPPLTQKFPTADSESISLVDHKSPSPSPCGSSDITLFPTCSEVPSPLHTPASVPSKGILKISHRSCKGICLCSDCASFRLQAEKASEFSERQLRETETLAVALMSELTNVRNLMEKYLIAKGKGTGILCSIPHSQLKDASRSALRVEETARNHLVQMTRDCHLHCKILRMQQRRVKFADKVEVKTFKSE
ncbi:hypothetical protein SUGI_1029420 [Cryptomeria japonica]|uniref:uncharacterized protein LOC131036712 isoform X2 n=1 Tax=Cryptomeria japonica TaxID=3369 RepID=UPI002414B200|nr:uncharacterized protein LOC131036712 isoform X2 [Cryptomeria japonica]GLJ48815.1 hypothetical protein SUGI_1029420 [Cryptomeria japonica]